MKMFRLFRKNQKAPPAVTRGASSDKSSQLTLQLEELERRQRELERTIVDIPKQLEERRRREQEMIRDRAKRQRTLQDLDRKPRGIGLKARGPSWQKMSLAEQRKALTRLFVLIAVFGFLLFLLLKSFP